jgi:branched-chain amino acid transport system substrate-binding protein
MICNVRIIQFASSAMAACALLSSALASAQGVKIGVLNDQSGVYADFGGRWSVEAAKMAIEDFGGSLLGEKIELISADHQNKVDLATAIARRWYDVEGVDMITDLTSSAVALAVQQIAAEKKKIDIVVASATSALTGAACTPYGFHWAYDTHALAVSTGGALVKTGGDTWFFITVNYAAGHAMEKDTSDVIKAEGGQVLGHVLYPLTPPTSRPSCCRRKARRRRLSFLPMPAKTSSIRLSKRRNSVSSPAASGLRYCC